MGGASELRYGDSPIRQTMAELLRFEGTVQPTPFAKMPYGVFPLLCS